MELSRFIELFLYELDEELNEYSSSLIELEENPSRTNIIDDLFINVHTIKGSSNTLLNSLNKEKHEITPLLSQIASLSHRFEDYIDFLKKSNEVVDKIDLEYLIEFESILKLFIPCLQENQIVDFSDRIELFLNKTSLRMQNNTEPIKFHENTKEISRFFFEITLTSDEELKHGYLSIIYRDIKMTFDDCYFNPTEEQLLKGEDFNKITIQINTDKSLVETQSIISDIEYVGEVKNIPYRSIVKNEKNPETPLTVSFANNTDSNTAKTDESSSKRKQQPLRIEPKRIDNVLKHTSKLVILKNKLDEFLSQNQFLAGTNKRKELEAIFDDINLHVDLLQESVLEIRMTPFEQLFSRFPRDVKTISKQYNKQVRLETYGASSEIDKAILDDLFDPFMHLIKNAITHGIETPDIRKSKGKNEEGLISITAKHNKNRVIITITDDGKGIDVNALKQSALDKNLIPFSTLSSMSNEEAFNLIFKPGISTMKIADNNGGRGIGMDAVKKKIEEINGSISVVSEVDKGTVVTLSMPLTTAIIDGMITRINGEYFTFPISQVEEVINIKKEEIRNSHNNNYIFLKDKEIPIILSEEFFNLKRAKENSTPFVKLMILRSHDNLIGMTIDEYLGQQSIVVKSMHPFIQAAKGISSCNILGDGSISLIVDANELMTNLIKN